MTITIRQLDPNESTSMELNKALYVERNMADFRRTSSSEHYRAVAVDFHETLGIDR